MNELLVPSVFMLLIGLLSAVFPYRMAKLSEAVDAIGSKRKSSEVEPADWKVLLTRVTGVLAMAISVYFLFLGGS